MDWNRIRTPNKIQVKFIEYYSAGNARYQEFVSQVLVSSEQRNLSFLLKVHHIIFLFDYEVKNVLKSGSSRNIQNQKINEN